MPGIGRSLALCSASLVLAGMLVGPVQAGDAARGYAVVTRQTSTCVLCHAGPFPDAHLQGSVGPDLHGVGARLSEAEIRAQIVDPSGAYPGTVMPSFGVVAGTRVGTAWAGRTILSPQEIEDAAAYLATLH